LLDNPRADVAQVLGGRFRFVQKVSVRVAAAANGFDSERLQQKTTERAAGAAIGVEESAQSGGTDARRFDQLQDASAMQFSGLAVIVQRAQRVPWHPPTAAVLEQCLHLAPLGGAEDAAIKTEQFESVPRRGIVAGGDLDAAGRLQLAHG